MIRTRSAFFDDRMTDRSVEGHFPLLLFAVSAIFVETRWDTHEQLPVRITDETTLADTLECLIE